MNCKTCGYRLWNLPPGTCPECGSPFRPSDFEFRRDAVEYVCLKCSQAYYGTDERGHLVPPAFICIGCQQATEMDRMLVRPAAGVPEERTAVMHNPWTERARRGYVSAWFAAMGQGMVLPHRLIAATEPAGGTGAAVGFAAVTQLIYHLVGFLPFIALFAVMGLMGPGVGSGEWLALPLVFVAAVGITLGGLGVWGLMVHGLLLLTGRTNYGIGRTYQCLCYSSAANWFAAIPCLNMYFGWLGGLWWAVCATIMVVRGQGVGAGRASFAVLTLPAVLILALAGLITWAVLSIQGTIPLAPSTPVAVAGALQGYGAMNAGRAPAHALDLVATQTWLDADMFISEQTPTLLEDVTIVEGVTLADFDAASPAEKRRLAGLAGAALPPDVIAHRVGDYVFTYHGLQVLSVPAGGLWTMIEWADPDTTPDWSPDVGVEVGLAYGSTRFIMTAAFDSELKAQNALRQQHNLPPLPHPATVTHSKPASR